MLTGEIIATRKPHSKYRPVASIASIVLTMAFLMNHGQAIELISASPFLVPPDTDVPIVLEGLIPGIWTIATEEEAEAIYRVYIGHAPWTASEIAPFRVAEPPGNAVITFGEPNHLFVTTPSLNGSPDADILLVAMNEPFEEALLLGGLNIDTSSESFMVPLTPGEVWVDFNHPGGQFGTMEYPFQSMAAALAVAAPADVIKIVAGESPEILTINQPVELRAMTGTVTLGRGEGEPTAVQTFEQAAVAKADVPGLEACQDVSEVDPNYWSLSNPSPIVLPGEKGPCSGGPCNLESGEPLPDICPGQLYQFTAAGGDDGDVVEGPVTDEVSGAVALCDTDADGDTDCAPGTTCVVVVSNARNPYGWNVTGLFKDVYFDPGPDNMYRTCYVKASYVVPAEPTPYTLRIERIGASVGEIAGIENKSVFSSEGSVSVPGFIPVTAGVFEGGSVNAEMLMQEATGKIFLQDSSPGNNVKLILEDQDDVSCCKGIALQGETYTYTPLDVFGVDVPNTSSFAKVINQATWQIYVEHEWTNKPNFVVLKAIDYKEDDPVPRPFTGANGHAYVVPSSGYEVWAHEWGHLSGQFGGSSLPDYYNPQTMEASTAPSLIHNLMNVNGEYVLADQCADLAPKAN